jgi:prepilin-type processing-associated H-X9-DG protein
LNRFQRPADTIWLADNEHGSWRPIITDLGVIGSDQLNEVLSPEHPHYAPGGVSLRPERRVALARHARRPNLLFFDGHSALKRAKLITVDDWREQRR